VPSHHTERDFGNRQETRGVGVRPACR